MGKTLLIFIAVFCWGNFSFAQDSNAILEEGTIPS